MSSKFQKEIDCLKANFNDIQLTKDDLKRILNHSLKTKNDANCMESKYILFKYMIVNNLISNPESGKNKYRDFQESYNGFWVTLCACLSKPIESLSTIALEISMNLIEDEANNSNTINWPTKRLALVLDALVNSNVQAPNPMISANFTKYSNNVDIIQQTYKILPTLIPDNLMAQPKVAINCLKLILTLDLNKNIIEADERYISEDRGGEFDYTTTKTFLSDTWTKIMNACDGVSENMHREVMIVLLERILPHLDDPIHLTDFLMYSLHKSDERISLFGLQAIFTLMQKHNISYPDIYEKLYTMFTLQMLVGRYKARFLYLADLFLTSTHLPETLVAAFVKRLSVLSIAAGTEDNLIMINFIRNLLLRHTGLQRMINANLPKNGGELIDPFDATETNPTKTNAINSSLWELEALKYHVLPEVANAARLACGVLPKQEIELDDMLTLKASNIFLKEINKKPIQVAAAITRPTVDSSTQSKKIRKGT